MDGHPVLVSDEELVRAAQAGDIAALGALLEAHQARLYATALTIVRDRARAQDAVQDTFVVALRRLGELREPAAVGAWLQTIVRNACRMQVRRSHEVLAPIAIRDEPHHSEVDEAFEQVALRDWLWTALESLPDDLRATVALRYFTRHTAYAEIAAILGIPIGTVRSRLNQAKRRLADTLLASAPAVHRDQAALVAQRWDWWSAVVEQVRDEGKAALWTADAAPEALVEAPLFHRVYSVDDQARSMVETIAAGVQVHLTGVVASAGVTIIEAEYENPPDDPHHCPATHTEVRFHPNGRTTRIILYYGSPTMTD